jgi:hypothetical protein
MPNSCYYYGRLGTLNVRVFLTATKFKPVVSSMLGLAFACISNIQDFVILYDFCVLSAYFFVINLLTFAILNARHKPRIDVRLGKLPTMRRTLILQCCNFKAWLSSADFQVGQV